MSATRKDFIESTYQLLKTVPPQELSARDVAAHACLSTNELFNCFEIFDDLVRVASFRFMKQYTKDVRALFDSERNGLELNLQLWERLAECSFDNPLVFDNLFFGKASAEQIGEAAKIYYEEYPEEIEGMPDYLTSVLSGSSMSQRNAILPNRACEEGIISAEAADYLSKVDCYLYRGMLATACNAGYLGGQANSMRSEFIDLLVKTYRAQLNEGYTIETRELNRPVNGRHDTFGTRDVTFISVVKE